MSILSSQSEGVVTLTLSRSEKKNALTQAMYLALAKGINEAAQNADVKAIVLTGEQGVFTAGNDLHDFLEFPDVPPEETAPFQFLTALASCQIPIIAAVEGPAIGIGSTLLLHCERVFADQSAIFAFPFINLGLVAEAASSLLLPRQVGYQQAADWLLTGEAFTSDQALRAGLVGEQTQAGEAYHQAFVYAKKLATKSRQQLIEMKRLLNRAEEPVMDRMLIEFELFAEKLRDPSAMAMIEAFLASRSKK
ncbi:MAG: enoyl-CoA hydratase-related protein [Cellvibrionales bacterium]|nr:enoyl-CoA hydratase-related protein [Cellvibrionales bacterium]